jgi:hypothetical protein
MNGTTSTATYSSVSRSSSRTRPAHYRTQSTRSQPQSPPPIDTAVPTTYSRVHQRSPSGSTAHPPGSYAALQGRQISSSSAASSSSSHTHASLFSNSGETLTTATSAGSFTASSSTSTGHGYVGEDDEQDTMRVYGHDRDTTPHPNGKGKTPAYQRPLSPTESLDSIGA